MKVKGKSDATAKEKARVKLRCLWLILKIVTVVCCVLMLVNITRALLGRNGLMQQVGGEEKMAQMSEAEVEHMYFEYINGKLDRAKTTVGKLLIWGPANLACFVLLHFTAHWHLGVAGTVWFTIFMFFQLVALAICCPLGYKWHKIATVAPPRQKTVVDLEEELNRELEQEVQKKAKQRKNGDLNSMTTEELDALMARARKNVDKK